MAPPTKKYLRKLEPFVRPGEQVTFACMALGTSGGLVTRAFAGASDDGAEIAARVPTTSRMILGFTDQRLLVVGDGLIDRGKLTELAIGDVVRVAASAATVRTGELTLEFSDASALTLRLPAEDSRAAATFFAR